MTRTSLIETTARRFGLEPDKVMATLKATAFKKPKDGPDITNEQMAALLIVANQYNLNPFTREIYAFPDKGGIVPIVGIDGWSRICNETDQFDGVSFLYAEDTDDGRKHCPRWVECAILKTGQREPVVVREYLDECYRNTSPWNSHPKRMLRHKAFIQAARLAFGFAGIYDKDEARAIVHGEIVEAPASEESDKVKALIANADTKEWEDAYAAAERKEHPQPKEDSETHT